MPYESGLSCFVVFTPLETNSEHETYAEQRCCDIERLVLELGKGQRPHDAGASPCREHEAIYLADVARTEVVCRECWHGGEAAAVAGKQVACCNQEDPVAADDTHGHQDVDDSLGGEHESEDSLPADGIRYPCPEKPAQPVEDGRDGHHRAACHCQGLCEGFGVT